MINPCSKPLIRGTALLWQSETLRQCFVVHCLLLERSVDCTSFSL